MDASSSRTFYKMNKITAQDTNYYLSGLHINACFWFVIAGLFCAISVVMGAFAAHALKQILSEYQLGIIDTASRYMMYHGLAILGCSTSAILVKFKPLTLHVVNVLFSVGIILFSGSLYILGLSKLKFVVYLTPVGGCFLIVAWLYFMLSTLKRGRQIKSALTQ